VGSSSLQDDDVSLSRVEGRSFGGAEHARTVARLAE